MHNHNGVKKLPFLMAMAVSATIALSACGSSGSGSSGSGSAGTGSAGTGSAGTALPTKLTEPTKPVTINYAGAAYSAADIKPVIQAFEKLHPNIKVNYEADPFENFNSIISAQLTGKDKNIDVFDVDMPRTDAYANRGWLDDLSSAFPNVRSQIDPASLAAATVNGKLMALPYQTSTNIMYYNKTLLKAAGIPSPSSSPASRMTWEQVTADATKAKGAGAKWGLVFDQIDRYYQLEPVSSSADGGPGATGPGNLTPDITDAGWTKAMDLYSSLFKDGLSPRGVAAAQTPDLFASGQVAYYVGGPWWAPQFEANKSLDFGVAAFPEFAGGTAATPTGGWSLGLSPLSTNKDAALIFMKFMALDNGGYSQYLTALAVPPSNLHGSQQFYNSAAFKDPRMAGAVALMKYELAHTAILRLKTVGYIEFENIITRAYDDIINGANVTSTLQSASANLKSTWALYQS